MPTANNAHAEAEAHRYKQRHARVVELLRFTAERVERMRVVDNLRDLKPDYGHHAADVIHEVLWTVANLNLDALTSAAADADRAVRLTLAAQQD